MYSRDIIEVVKNELDFNMILKLLIKSCFQYISVLQSFLVRRPRKRRLRKGEDVTCSHEGFSPSVEES